MPNGATSRTELTPEIAGLVTRLAAEPDSAELRYELLWAFCGEPALHAHPIRMDQILWHVRNIPRDSFTRCPCAHIDAKQSPEGFVAVRREWEALHAQHPTDSEIARGYAEFIAIEDSNTALTVLHGIVARDPGDTEAWVDLGRLCLEPVERLQSFLEARRRGSSHPNLLKWSAMAATAAGDMVTAEEIGRELLAPVELARAQYGDRIDWRESGAALWQKARAVTGSDEEARELVGTISSHAYGKHWGHTALGIVAVRNADTSQAIEHLKQSAEVVGDCRLGSYGPSLELARELCTAGFLVDVAAYLRACQSFWSNTKIDGWCAGLEAGRIPDFPET